MNKKKSQLLALFAAIGLGVFTFWSYMERQESKQQQTNNDQELFLHKLQIAEGLIHRKHPQNALILLKSNLPGNEQTPTERQRWFELTLKAADGLENQKILTELYELNPSLFNEKEPLALKVAAYYLQKGDYISYDQIKNHFKEQPKHSPEWEIMTADALAIQGRPEQAQALLESLKLQGSLETERLLRLALLDANEHPKYAFEKLSKALKSSPLRSDIHYYRAKLIKNTGHEELALKEIEQALKVNPENPFYREELIDAYLEKAQWTQAYQALQDFYMPPSSGRIWLAALFLDKIYKPFATHFDNRPLPEDKLTPLIRYFLTVGRNNYWDEALLQSQPSVKNLANQTPQALWLELLHDLNIGYEKKAFALTETHPEIASIHPELFEGIKRTLAFRLRQPIPHSADEKLSTTKPHPLFSQLNAPPYSKELENLLASDEASSALFLAAGWNEAAIREHKLAKIPADFPKWIAFSFTQALNENRSPEEALLFAYAQPETPQLSLLIGTLELKAHHKDKGIAILKTLAKNPTDVGVKAAKALTDFQIQNKDWNGAYETIGLNPAFAQSLEGRERLAKVQLVRGKVAEAQEIYQSILETSSEAQSFFAAKYFQQKDYANALILTRQLLKQFPYREDLKEQLAQIEKAKASANSKSQNQ